MSRLAQLKTCSNLEEFAKLIGYTSKGLGYILYKLPEGARYTEFTVPKKRGGERKIKAPTAKLKQAQQRLAAILTACTQELEEIQMRKPLSHGFKKGHSTMTNARRHNGRRYVFNTDLKDFFPSINFGRVRGFFIKNKDFSLHPDVATIVAQIACHDNELPQGSPCSPIISNLLAHLLDVRLAQLAKKHTCTYSRYADDLTFSTNQLEFASDIACLVEADGGLWKVGKALEKIVTRVGFEINHSKTRMQYRQSRQIVTGLTVNRHVNTPAEYYRTTRAMCRSLFKTNEFFLPINNDKGTLAQLEGTLSYVYHIKNLSDHRDEATKKHAPLGPTRLYTRFLQYKCFFALKMPLIICEGKTDSVYLKSALRRLRLANPTLIKSMVAPPIPPKKATETSFKVRFHKYLNTKNHTTVTSNLLKLYGGAGGLKILMADYLKLGEEFCKTPRQHPVILLVDNDSGAEEIFSTLKEIRTPSTKGMSKAAAKKVKSGVPTITGDKPFYYVHDNLYLVPTPKTAGKDTKIEDFFEPKLLTTIISGKKFNPENNQSAAAGEYGKVVFAEQVVRKHEDTINFEGFQPLLTNVARAMEHFYSGLGKEIS